MIEATEGARRPRWGTEAQRLASRPEDARAGSPQSSDERSGDDRDDEEPRPIGLDGWPI